MCLISNWSQMVFRTKVAYKAIQVECYWCSDLPPETDFTYALYLYLWSARGQTHTVASSVMDYWRGTWQQEIYLFYIMEKKRKHLNYFIYYKICVSSLMDQKKGIGQVSGPYSWMSSLSWSISPPPWDASPLQGHPHSIKFAKERSAVTLVRAQTQLSSIGSSAH